MYVFPVQSCIEKHASPDSEGEREKQFFAADEIHYSANDDCDTNVIVNIVVSRYETFTLDPVKVIIASTSSSNNNNNNNNNFNNVFGRGEV